MSLSHVDKLLHVLKLIKGGTYELELLKTVPNWTTLVHVGPNWFKLMGQNLSNLVKRLQLGPVWKFHNQGSYFEFVTKLSQAILAQAFLLQQAHYTLLKR